LSGFFVYIGILL